MAILFVFINSFSNQNISLAKSLRLINDSAAASGGKEKLIYFFYFHWNQLEAELPISASLFSYLRVIRSFCFLFMKAVRKLYGILQERANANAQKCLASGAS